MKKVLICEDEKGIQELLKGFLAENEYEVDIATDGKKAVSKAEKNNPDLIILDIRMPKLNGLEAAEEIRKFNKKARLIFLTGFQSPQLKEEAAKYDIFAYIIKSSPISEILQVIQRALE